MKIAYIVVGKRLAEPDDYSYSKVFLNKSSANDYIMYILSAKLHRPSRPYLWSTPSANTTTRIRNTIIEMELVDYRDFQIDKILI